MKKSILVLELVCLVAILAIPRFTGLDRFVTVDEPAWLVRGANFYYALGQRDFQNTLAVYHPAVTTMWAVTGGFLLYFREYRGLHQGYLKKVRFDALLAEYGRTDLGLLLYSRAVQEALIILLLLLLFFLLRYLCGNRTAFFTTALVSLSPYFLGHSRLLNHEALMGLFILLSILGLAVYLFKKQNILFLILSAAAGALAQLTKSTAFLLFPAAGVIFLVHFFSAPRRSFWRDLASEAGRLGAWLLILAAAYVLFWPGMWVAPGRMLYEVYGNALSYAFQGGELSVTQGINVARPHFSMDMGTMMYFLLILLWHTTPLTWIGFLAGMVMLFARRGGQDHRLHVWLVLTLLFMTSLFLVLFTVANGRDSPHYILTGFICVVLIAGLGWSWLVEWLAGRWSPGLREGMVWGALVLLIASEALAAWGSFPYYYTYLNPWMKAIPAAQTALTGTPNYGEGLDQAAAYLSQKPDASRLTVMSYCGYGCFSYLFPGNVIGINELSIKDMDDLMKGYLQSSDYVVLDHQYQEREGLLPQYAGLTPEKIIWISGVDVLDIYKASDLQERAEHPVQ